MRQIRFKFRCNILISGKIIEEMPGSVASGTLCINFQYLFVRMVFYNKQFIIQYALYEHKST